MRGHCIEKKTVSRAGKPHEVCAKYASPQDDVLVERGDENMGAYTIDPLRGIMAIKADDVIGPAVGGIATVAGTLLARRYGSRISPYVVKYAPFAGILVGALAAIPLGQWKGKKAMQSGVVTSLVVGAALFGLEKMGAMGAIVMQPVRGMHGMGALPAVQGSGRMPRQLRQGVDKGAYGKTWG